MKASSLTLLAVLASAARAVRVGQPAQRAGSREVVARASATATAAAAYSTWADLASEPQLLPEAQAARTVMEVSPIAQLCLASSADGVDGTVCARLVAGSPSRPEPVRLAGGDQIFGVDEDGSPLFGLRPGSQAALDLAASASVSFAAHAPTGGAQAGCAVTLLGGTRDRLEMDPRWPRDMTGHACRPGRRGGAAGGAGEEAREADRRGEGGAGGAAVVAARAVSRPLY